MKLTIRPEIPADFPVIRELVMRAFAGAEHADGTEQDLVERIRSTGDYIPALSLVAEQEGELVGHIMLSKARLGSETVLAVAPLAVEPHWQSKGIGGALLAEGHRIARERGYRCCILLGHEGYYPRFGYRPASGLGIRAPFEVADANFMALDLTGEGKRMEGVISYSSAFEIE